MPDSVTAFAPGRVNLIGEHTDYNEGLALPFAIREGVTVTARPSGDDRVTVVAHDLSAHDAFDVRAPRPVNGWRNSSRAACRNCRSRPYSPAVPYCGSPHTGWPIAARWTRI